MRTQMCSVFRLSSNLLKLDREPDEKRTLKRVTRAATTVDRHIDDILDVTQLARLEKKGKRLPSNEPGRSLGYSGNGRGDATAAYEYP